MNKRKRFEGVVIPTVTPISADHRLDEAAVIKMFAHFRTAGVMPFILGTTGEASSLSQVLKQQFIRLAGKLKESGDVLYVGISATCLEESIELARYSFDAGADAVVANLPSYYALSEAEMEKYFEQLAEAAKGPLILYNIPSTTHMSIPLPLIDRLSHHPHIVGVKDSERNEERLNESLRLWANREDFSHLLGWAAKSAEALLNGSDGLVPSTGNVLPGIYSNLWQATRAGDREKAFQMQQRSDVVGDVYQKGRTLGQSLWALKVLMQEEGLCAAHVMPPLQVQGSEEEIKLKQQWKTMAGYKVNEPVMLRSI